MIVVVSSVVTLSPSIAFFDSVSWNRKTRLNTNTTHPNHTASSFSTVFEGAAEPPPCLPLPIGCIPFYNQCWKMHAKRISLLTGCNPSYTNIGKCLLCCLDRPLHSPQPSRERSAALPKQEFLLDVPCEWHKTTTRPPCPELPSAWLLRESTLILPVWQRSRTTRR